MPARAASSSQESKSEAPESNPNMRTTRSRKAAAMIVDEKENGNVVPAKSKAKSPTKRSAKNGKTKKEEELFCTCRGYDDGTPMVQCSQCDEWYHFRCIKLGEDEASEIRVYVCPGCQEKTGRRTVMDWEGPEALEEVLRPQPSTSRKTQKKPTRAESEESEVEQKPVPAEVSESSDEGSEDEYVDDGEPSKGKGTGKRSARRLTVSSDSEHEHEGKKAASSSQRRASVVSKATTKSVSPAPTPLKRKQSTASQQVSSKRKRSESTASDDTTRKYCLQKLVELFSGIFNQYPYIFPEDGDGTPTEKKSEELSDEDKSHVETRATAFATELEQCLYETYSEPDKQGKHAASTKYKERFRMITYNLGQADRIALHKRISSGAVPAKTVSVMSSTDLASEDQQEVIKQAEQEALAHSILQKSTVPRAKITHKGLQDIEDVNEELQKQREREIARENEEEERERRERERLLRLRPVQPHAGPSSSLPPESPVTPAWGAPPPVPVHAERVPVNPLFVASAADGEHELNLGDFIHMDDDDDPPADSALAPFATGGGSPQTKASVLSPTPTAISPFAASKPDMPPRASFDLDAVWSAPKPADETDERLPRPPPAGEQKHVAMDVDPIGGEGGDDLDFDMFLGHEDEAPAAPEPEPPSPEEVFDSLPRVWNGIVSMPLDSSIPQEIQVSARQIGGRSLEQDSLLWKTLFPLNHLRIDGRVAVNSSAQYLLQSRMNSAKELIAVAFSPGSEEDIQKLKNLSDFLIGKDRHGLIFPWGSRGREWGRELYVIPLLTGHTLPEYIEILDDLKIPNNRKEDCLVGIWVLQRGKLAPPPVQAQSQIPPQHVAPPAIAVPQLPISLPQNQNSQASYAQQALPPGLVNLPNIPSIPQPPAPSTFPPAPAPAPDLAAQIASLRPEQIQQMLQSLQPASAAAAAYPAPPPAFAPQPPPPSAWPPNFNPPPHAQPTPVPIPQPQPPPPMGYPQYDHYDERPVRGGYQYDRGDRGERGHGRGRGRGRSRGRGQGYEEPRRAPDSGWASRGRARGGPPGSPERYARRGDAPPYWS
ncbi:hypothetical protein BV25DRAFT_929645 [Artomyces pyxidatus]|uniref:Uncharacterized protein n=1 Tax=Artomyces pyxidatus TaxID=48021 RepID=A0ACB8SWB6_9AGAM|nr:hypothetical protein BV25DRAFT_929645 [Artomyces pyxidatus]